MAASMVLYLQNIFFNFSKINTVFPIPLYRESLISFMSLFIIFSVARVQATRFVPRVAISLLVPPSISNTDVKILCFYLNHIKGTRIKQENQVQGQDQYHSHVFSGSRTINHTKRTK